MRNFSQLTESKSLDIQDSTVGYATVDQLQKYLTIADKFISQEAKDVCKYLIDNNDAFVKKFGKGSGNALADFYEKGIPSQSQPAADRELYRNLGILSKKNRLLEVPVFMNREQFDAILTKKEAPDAILMDLETEAGRNKIAKDYTPLCHKIAKSFIGRSTLGYDDLLSAAYEGLTYALNSYGKKSPKQLKREEGGGDELDIQHYKAYTFLSYASYLIRFNILAAIKDSHLVRIPNSAQQREREEKGYNVKSHTVSGDKRIGSSDDENSKTLFDLIGDVEDAGKSIDREETEKLLNAAFKRLEQKFGEKTMDIWYSYNELNGHKKMKGKDLAVKYGYRSPGAITAELTKVNKFIVTDKSVSTMLRDAWEMMRECLHQEDLEREDEDPKHMPSSFFQKDIVKEDEDL